MNLIFRWLKTEDLEQIKNLAALIWEGHDYLWKVAPAWLSEGGFMGMFDGSQLIGCAKLTHLPDGVIWLEGLRVHPDYRSQGLGRKLSGMMLGMAKEALNAGRATAIEFSTYYKNLESIHISSEAGFKVVDEFFLLGHTPVTPAEPGKLERDFDGLDSYFPVYYPCGWKFYHPGKEALQQLSVTASRYKSGPHDFYVGGSSPSICLLSQAGDWILSALPYMQFMVGEGNDLDLLLHVSRAAELEKVMEQGFEWWESDGQDKVLVFRYLPD